MQTTKTVKNRAIGFIIVRSIYYNVVSIMAVYGQLNFVRITYIAYHVDIRLSTI